MSRDRTVYRPVKSVPLDEIIEKKISMLGVIPTGYAKIESDQDAIEEAYKNKAIRVHIIWDNTVDNFPLDEVLDKMRETGAAMVVKVEAVS